LPSTLVWTETTPPTRQKGYGIWLTKFVCSRKAESNPSGKQHRGPEPTCPEFGDELQTDEILDQDIVEQMGHKFYLRMFSPAVAKAGDGGEKCGDFLDSTRKDSKRVKRARMTRLGGA
jgi:hypothetical protein